MILRRVSALLALACILASLPAFSLAQDQPNPDQLRKMYDDSQEKLKASQDRKNELASENEKLTAKTAELQKQLDSANTQVKELQRQQAGWAEQTFYLRSHYAAWQNFIQKYPALLARWKVFMENDQITAPHGLQSLLDSGVNVVE